MKILILLLSCCTLMAAPGPVVSTPPTADRTIFLTPGNANALQWSVRSLMTNTNVTQAPGGGTIDLQPGIFNVTSQLLLSNRFNNPIRIRGSSIAPGSILNFRVLTNCIQTITPYGSGIYSLIFENLTITCENIITNVLVKIIDPNYVYCRDVTFAGYGYLTNGGMSGNIFQQFSTAHQAGTVGIQLGDANVGQGDGTAGLAEFHNCRFWNLSSGGMSIIDHVWHFGSSFALIGGNNKYVNATNMWNDGGSFHLPESAFKHHVGWVNNSVWGDVIFDDCSSYYTRIWCMSFRNGLGGHVLYRNHTFARLEGSAWLYIAADDITGIAELDIPPTTGTYGILGTLNKTTGLLRQGTPAGVYFSGTDAAFGTTNIISSVRGPYIPPLHTIRSDVDRDTYSEIGSLNGRNTLRGNNVLDKLSAGVSVDLGSATVTVGTDTGITGTYNYEGITPGAGGGLSRSWTNALFRLTTAGVSGYGGFFTKADTNFLDEQYTLDAHTKWADNAYIGVAGTYSAVNGGGTPPVVTHPVVTNTTVFAGGMSAMSLLIPTNSTLPNNTTTIRSWINLTNQSGKTCKVPVYE